MKNYRVVFSPKNIGEFDCMPAAFAQCRRNFMKGDTEPCLIEQDGLIVTVELKPGWDCSAALP